MGTRGLCHIRTPEDLRMAPRAVHNDVLLPPAPSILRYICTPEDLQVTSEMLMLRQSALVMQQPVVQCTHYGVSSAHYTSVACNTVTFQAQTQTLGLATATAQVVHPEAQQLEAQQLDAQQLEVLTEKSCNPLTDNVEAQLVEENLSSELVSNVSSVGRHSAIGDHAKEEESFPTADSECGVGSSSSTRASSESNHDVRKNSKESTRVGSAGSSSGNAGDEASGGEVNVRKVCEKYKTMASHRSLDGLQDSCAEKIYRILFNGGRKRTHIALTESFPRLEQDRLDVSSFCKSDDSRKLWDIKKHQQTQQRHKDGPHQQDNFSHDKKGVYYLAPPAKETLAKAMREKAGALAATHQESMKKTWSHYIIVVGDPLKEAVCSILKELNCLYKDSQVADELADA